jgi:hypothetical protein
VISGNTVTVIAPDGEGKLEGVGLTNNGPLLLRRVRITDNTGTVRAPAGSAHGGGIWNGSSFAGPDSTLTLDHTLIAGNVLRSAADLALQGAGIYTPGFAVPRTQSRVVTTFPTSASAADPTCAARRQAATHHVAGRSESGALFADNRQGFISSASTDGAGR